MNVNYFLNFEMYSYCPFVFYCLICMLSFPQGTKHQRECITCNQNAIQVHATIDDD